ncbi:putative carbonic anhydrase 3 [Antedon mediterranea]|uniref:putative carbonic anhydrase 3 n=1 Tax=Antedon mediterranea TaxID=105859 RepID=UPI003AF94E56
MKLYLNLVTVCLLFNSVFAGSSVYTYDNVNEWPTLFPESCAGSRQSPIDVESDEAEYKAFDEFVIAGYDDESVAQTLVNNGHTVQLAFEGDYNISGGGLPDAYHAAQIHFHWGSIDSQGSEHTVDGQHYPAEMHIVHVKDGMELADAVNDPIGLAVLGVHIEVGDVDNEDFVPILAAVQQLKDNEVATLNSTIILSHLLPDSTDHFYRYDGSLTTPSCNEAVIWTVFEKSIVLSSEQMEIFRALDDNDGHTLSDNWRPPQPRLDRVLYKSYYTDPSVASMSTMSVMTLIVAAVFVRLSSF